MGILHEPSLVISKPQPTDEEIEAQRGERVNSNPALTCCCSSPSPSGGALLTLELELGFPGPEKEQQ